MSSCRGKSVRSDPTQECGVFPEGIRAISPDGTRALWPSTKGIDRPGQAADGDGPSSHAQESHAAGLGTPARRRGCRARPRRAASRRNSAARHQLPTWLPLANAHFNLPDPNVFAVIPIVRLARARKIRRSAGRAVPSTALRPHRNSQDERGSQRSERGRPRGAPARSAPALALQLDALRAGKSALTARADACARPLSAHPDTGRDTPTQPTVCAARRATVCRRSGKEDLILSPGSPRSPEWEPASGSRSPSGSRTSGCRSRRGSR